MAINQRKYDIIGENKAAAAASGGSLKAYQAMAKYQQQHQRSGAAWHGQRNNINIIENRSCVIKCQLAAAASAMAAKKKKIISAAKIERKRNQAASASWRNQQHQRKASA